MKTPLIRQGGGQDAVIQIYEEQRENERELDRLIDIANSTMFDDRPRSNTAGTKRRRAELVAARSAAGDEDRLRALPAIARGVAGAIPGSTPGSTRRRWLSD